MDFFQKAKGFGREVLEFASAASFEIQTSAKDFARTGFGAPRVVTAATGFACAAVAAVGTVRVTADVAGKIYGKKDCVRCGGWETLRCKECLGEGRVKFRVTRSGLDPKAERQVDVLAGAVAAGKADVELIPKGLAIGEPLPCQSCPECEGNGIMKCPLCKGSARKWDRVSFDGLFGGAIQSWQAYEHSSYQPVTEGYDELRTRVVRMAPGWEEAQQALIRLDAVQAAEDPMVLPEVPLVRNIRQLAAEVAALPTPARPADWKVSDAEAVPRAELDRVRDPRLRRQLEALTALQVAHAEEELDAEWAQTWRMAELNKRVKEAERRAGLWGGVSGGTATTRRQGPTPSRPSGLPTTAPAAAPAATAAPAAAPPVPQPTKTEPGSTDTAKPSLRPSSKVREKAVVSVDAPVVGEVTGGEAPKPKKKKKKKKVPEASAESGGGAKRGASG